MAARDEVGIAAAHRLVLRGRRADVRHIRLFLPHGLETCLNRGIRLDLAAGKMLLYELFCKAVVKRRDDGVVRQTCAARDGREFRRHEGRRLVEAALRAPFGIDEHIEQEVGLAVLHRLIRAFVIRIRQRLDLDAEIACEPVGDDLHRACKLAVFIEIGIRAFIRDDEHAQFSMRAQIGAFLTVEQEWRPFALFLALVQDVGDDGRPRERQLILRALETREQCLVPLLY